MKIDTQTHADFQKIADLIEDIPIAMLTTIDEDDHMVSRPMSVLKMDGEGSLWFFTDKNSAKMNQLDRLNLGFSDAEESVYVSLAGTGELSYDQAMVHALWSPFMKPWFPDGEDSPDLALLKVTPHSAEYWDSTHNKMVRMFAIAASVVAAKPIGMGEHGNMSLRDSP